MTKSSVTVEPRLHRSANVRGQRSSTHFVSLSPWRVGYLVRLYHSYITGRNHISHTDAGILLLCSSVSAFVPSAVSVRRPQLAAASLSDEVDRLGNNLKVKSVLSQMQEKKLLSKVAESGLLSKAQAAGISLSSLEPLLEAVSKNPDILILVEASGPEVLPLLPALVDIAPSALPLLAAAVGIPPVLLQLVGVGALAAAGYAVVGIPDDTVANVAIQTIAVGLALPAAGAAFVGSSVLGQLKR